jgi:hypothetical protein
MDVGLIAEMIAGRYSGFPEPLEDAVTEHALAKTSASKYGADDIRIHSESRNLTEEVHLAGLRGLSLPDDSDWGYTGNWKPDDILAVKALTGVAPPLPPQGEREELDPTTELLGYYPIEVKATSRGNRVRLTENQHETLATVHEEVDGAHPVMVLVDISGLPESAEIVVDIYEESVWADGQKSKTIFLQRENPALPAKGERSDAQSEPRLSRAGVNRVSSGEKLSCYCWS